VIARITGHAMADAPEAGKFLGVEVQQLPRALALIAPGRLGLGQARKATKPEPGQPAGNR